MRIVEPSPGDISIREAAAHAGRSEKSLRRAVHAGHLPQRYVLGPRGLTLVFARDEVVRWRACLPRGYVRRQGTPPARAEGLLPALLGSLAGLRESLGAARAAVDDMGRQLGPRDTGAARARAAIEALEGRLAELERGLNSATDRVCC